MRIGEAGSGEQVFIPKRVGRVPVRWDPAALRDAEQPVIFFSNGIGDSLLTLPTMRALLEMFPGRLTLICPPEASLLCYSCLPFRRVVTLPIVTRKMDGDSVVRRDPRFFDAQLAAAEVGSCDVFLSVVPWHSECLQELVSRLIPHTTIGLFPFYDVCIGMRPAKHASDMAFELAKALQPSVRIDDFAAPPKLSAEVRERAAMLRANLPGDAGVLVVHPDTAAEKCWRPECYRWLFDAFLDRWPRFFIFVVGMFYEKLDTGRHSDRIISCMGLPLDFSVALLSRADVFLGVNSSMLHAADLFRVPGVGLFEPGQTERWGFRFGPHRHLEGKASPADIEENAVLCALEELIEEGSGIRVPKARNLYREVTLD